MSEHVTPKLRAYRIHVLASPEDRIFLCRKCREPIGIIHNNALYLWSGHHTEAMTASIHLVDSARFKCGACNASLRWYQTEPGVVARDIPA